MLKGVELIVSHKVESCKILSCEVEQLKVVKLYHKVQVGRFEIVSHKVERREVIYVNLTVSCKVESHKIVNHEDESHEDESHEVVSCTTVKLLLSIFKSRDIQKPCYLNGF